MKDFTAVDATLNTGYYQVHFEALPLVVLVVGLVVLVQWVLRAKQD